MCLVGTVCHSSSSFASFCSLCITKGIGRTLPKSSFPTPALKNAILLCYLRICKSWANYCKVLGIIFLFLLICKGWGKLEKLAKKNLEWPVEIFIFVTGNLTFINWKFFNFFSPFPSHFMGGKYALQLSSSSLPGEVSLHSYIDSHVLKWRGAKKRELPPFSLSSGVLKFSLLCLPIIAEVPYQFQSQKQNSYKMD